MDVTFPLCKSHFLLYYIFWLIFLLGIHQTASQGPVFTPISKIYVSFSGTFEENKYAGRKGRILWKPVAAGNKENIGRRVEQGSRNSVQQLKQRMQNLNETWRPKYASDCRHAIFSYSSICDFAAAEPWAQASQQDCLEGPALFQQRTDLLTSEEQRMIREGGNVCVPLEEGE